MSDFITASSYCESVFDGTHDTPKPVNSGYPLVTSKHIVGRTLDISTAYYISLEDYNAIQKRSKVSQWDVLFSMIGSVGEVYLEKNEVIPYAIKNIGVFSCKNEEKARWLYYYLQSPFATTHIKRYLNGAVQKFLSLGALREFPVLKFNKQSSLITKVLSDLDAKIELNNKINRELEAMAKTLYDYWFVQFDFPNEEGKPYKSSGGKMVYNAELKREIPEGWEVKKLSEIVETGSGGTPLSTKKEYYKNGNIPWINSGEVNEPYIVSTNNFITQKGLDNSSAKLFQKGTILMAMYGATAGKVSLIDIEASTNQAICSINPKKPFYKLFLLHGLQDLYQYLINLSSGSARDNLSQNKIKELQFLVPNNKLLSDFNKLTQPSVNRIFINLKVNLKLVSLRDWLLPMLMNGQVTVKEVEHH